MDILFVYKWCTMGGVERSLLNRAIALQSTENSSRLFVHFISRTSEVEALRRAISYYRLNNLSVIEESEIVKRSFDTCVSIDTPEMFSLPRLRSARWTVECHTTYPENQQYLNQLPPRVQQIVVPSEALKQQLEVFPLLGRPVNVLHNFVLQHEQVAVARRWTKPLLCYIGRLDEWKNSQELWQIMRRTAVTFESMRFLIASPQAALPSVAESLCDHGIRGSTVLLPAVPFECMPFLLSQLRSSKAIFISCSKGESFGLAAAEAMAAGLPVLLSDVPGHRRLVLEQHQFLYPVGDIEEAVKSVGRLSHDWEKVASISQSLVSEHQNVHRFMQEWNGVYKL